MEAVRILSRGDSSKEFFFQTTVLRPFLLIAL
jgi:hypothetical protein